MSAMFPIKIEVGQQKDDSDRLLAQYPGIPTAFEFVKPSYELLARRYELMESRIRALATFATTITIAGPAFAKAILGRDPDFTSAWFLIAMALYLFLAFIALGSTMTKSIQFVDPGMLYEGSLHLTETEFKRDMIFFAGEAFTRNMNIINIHARYGNWVALLSLVEGALLGVWVYSLR